MNAYYVSYFSRGSYTFKIVLADTYKQAIKKSRIKNIEEIKEMDEDALTKLFCDKRLYDVLPYMPRTTRVTIYKHTSADIIADIVLASEILRIYDLARLKVCAVTVGACCNDLLIAV